jgi:hypothetical protein
VLVVLLQASCCTLSISRALPQLADGVLSHLACVTNAPHPILLAGTDGTRRCAPPAVETLLERWVVHYYPQLPEGPSHLSRSQLSRLNPAAVYKRLVITLRSLYTYVRVLPAYRMYRACKVRQHTCWLAGRRRCP